MTSHSVTTAVVADNPQVHEDLHVHAIYDQIAPHFSSTRYKPWPIVTNFLSSLPTGWVGLDSGTGNGKYLQLPLERPGSVWTIGLDRSRNLLEIARTAGDHDVVREVVWGDVLGCGWRRAAFDYAISIATIHHLSTYERRKLAIQVCVGSLVEGDNQRLRPSQHLLQCVSPTHGRILIYVWAIEQDELSKRTILADCPASSSQTGLDVFVPWVLSKQRKVSEETDSGSSGITSTISEDKQTDNCGVFNRYYHMFAKGELVGLVSDAARELGLQIGPPLETTVLGSKTHGVDIVGNGWERSNYYVELKCWGRQ